MPLPPKAELQWWYQYYFATERGREGYSKYRREFAELIWKLASPKWAFDDGTFARSAAAFDNPDHVDIVIHNYRWRAGLSPGDPGLDHLEAKLAAAPRVSVPTITLEGDENGAPHPDPAAYARKFSGKYLHRLVKGGIGHNLPQEAPEAFAQAVDRRQQELTPPIYIRSKSHDSSPRSVPIQETADFESYQDRRQFLSTAAMGIVSASAASLLSTHPASAAESGAIRPFRINIPEERTRRPAQTREGDTLAGPGNGRRSIPGRTARDHTGTRAVLGRRNTTGARSRRSSTPCRNSSPRSTGSTFISFTFARNMKMRCR